MGLTVKNKNSFAISEDISNFFAIPIEEQKENNYEQLKKDIYELQIDNEEKASIINKINLLSTNISLKEKNNIIKEIDFFISKYNL